MLLQRYVFSLLETSNTQTRLFTAGIFLLPFVWAVNAVWFYNEAFKKPPYEQQKQIRNC